MARRESMSAAELREEQLRQIREAKQQAVIANARETGYSAAGQPIIGMSDSVTPLVTGKSGLQGGSRPSDSLAWANQFRRNDSQLQTPIAAVPVATPDVSAPSLTQGVLREISANPFAGSFNNFGVRSGQGGAPGYDNTPAPSISTLAQGGQNHAQMWQENALRGFQRVSPFVASGTRSFTDYGQGSRRPYIGGAGGDMTKDFVAGGRYSSYKPGTDSTLDQFSFASAFR